MRKTYDKKFKIEIAKQIVDKKTTVSNVASEYKISRPIVSRWVSEFIVTEIRLSVAKVKDYPIKQNNRLWRKKLKDSRKKMKS